MSQRWSELAMTEASAEARSWRLGAAGCRAASSCVIARLPGEADALAGVCSVFSFLALDNRAKYIRVPPSSILNTRRYPGPPQFVGM